MDLQYILESEAVEYVHEYIPARIKRFEEETFYCNGATKDIHAVGCMSDVFLFCNITGLDRPNFDELFDESSVAHFNHLLQSAQNSSRLRL